MPHHHQHSYPAPNLSRSNLHLEIIRPALLLSPNLLIVCLCMYFQLLKIRIDDFFATICALFAPAITTISSVLQRRTCLVCGSALDLSTTYDRSGLRSFDWEAVGLHWDAGSCCVGFAVLALDLRGMEVSRKREVMGGYATFAFFETGMLGIDLLPCCDVGAEMECRCGPAFDMKF